MINRFSTSGEGDQSGLQIQEFDADTLSRLNKARRNVLKVAVNVPGSNTHLYEINQSKTLLENLNEFCQRWSVKGNAEHYAFQHFDTKLYITETTRDSVKNGDLLCLATAPKKLLEDLMKQLRQPSTPEELLKALKQLAQSSPDPTFAEEFLGNHGMQWVVSTMEANECTGHSLAFLLAAFLRLMDHGLVDWDSVLTKELLKTICGIINKPPPDSDKILQHSLGIMECAVVNSKYYFEIEANLNLDTLISHLQKSNSVVQQCTIALLNSLFMKAPSNRLKISEIMSQKYFRTVVLNNVIRTPKTIESEMAHQLHVLQVLMFNTLEERMMKSGDPSSWNERDQLLEIRNIAFDSTQQQQSLPSSKKTLNPADFKKLGFVNYNNPVMDFVQTPPGLLCFDSIVYFARNQQDSYIRLVLENSSRDGQHVCPFGKASVELTKKLCEILRIGEQPTELGEDFYPMFFTHDHAFEEFYCICILLFNKTWKEMAAIKDDFEKVMSVVQDQIVLTLKDRPSSLDAFKQKLAALPYSEISKIREQEWETQETFASQATPVVELQREITPEIIELIKAQRLTYLREGTIFHGLGKKKTRWFCRLSPNLKVLHYGDIDDSDKSFSIDHLSNELAVADIKELMLGKECSHVKNVRAHKSITELAFSINYEQNKSLNFIAQSKDAFCMWVDGINILLGKKMTSPKAQSDQELLLTMEMKLRLLDIENIPIPDQPPAVPPLPKNYNFASPVA